MLDFLDKVGEKHGEAALLLLVIVMGAIFVTMFLFYLMLVYLHPILLVLPIGYATYLIYTTLYDGEDE